MAKTEMGRVTSKRVLFIDTRGLEVEVGEEEIHLLIEDTVPLPFKAFDMIEAWAKEAAGFDGQEAAVFKDEVAEHICRKLDERFLISRLS